MLPADRPDTTMGNFPPPANQYLFDKGAARVNNARILGRFAHWSAACFDEIARVVGFATDRHVVFNAHRHKVPEGAIVYNLEDPREVPDPDTRWPGHEVWDVNAANAKRFGLTHVPIGYHPAYTTFGPVAEPDIDIVFCGIVTQRRADILNACIKRGMTVSAPPPPCYGQRRNDLYARAKLVLDIQSFEDGAFNATRVSLLVANRIPVLCERTAETWDFVPAYDYGNLVDMAEILVRTNADARRDRTERALEGFKKMPMVLP